MSGFCTRTRRRLSTNPKWRERLSAARGYPLDAIHELPLHVPKPVEVSKNAGKAEKKTTAGLFVTVGRRRYVLLETEFHPDAHRHTQSKLENVTEQLANDLKVSWSQA